MAINIYHTKYLKKFCHIMSCEEYKNEIKRFLKANILKIQIQDISFVKQC